MAGENKGRHFPDRAVVQTDEGVQIAKVRIEVRPRSPIDIAAAAGRGVKLDRRKVVVVIK